MNAAVNTPEDAMTGPRRVRRDGGCACGYVRYTVGARPLIVHGCHCSLCQRQTGAPYAINALIEAFEVELTTGSLLDVHIETPTGKGQTVSRCPQCRVAVWSRYHVLPGDVLFVRVGTLDEPSAFPPDIHIHASSRQQHVLLPDGVPAVDGFYDIRRVWSPPSLARFQSLRDRSRAAPAPFE